MTVPPQPALDTKEAMGASVSKSKIVVAVRPKEKPDNFALYWITLPPVSAKPLDKPIEASEKEILSAVLSDELLDFVWLEEQGSRGDSWTRAFKAEGFAWFCEKQYLPGVTDNLAHTIEEALHLKGFPNGTRVCSGRGYLYKADAIAGREAAIKDACYKLYHPLTEKFVAHDLADGKSQSGSASGSGSDFLNFPELGLNSGASTALNMWIWMSMIRRWSL